MGRKRDFKTDIPSLKIPDVSKPPTTDGMDDFTIIQLNTDMTHIRELDRITQLARDGLFRKNLLLLRKERNLLIAVQQEQLRNFDSAIVCYERAGILAERLELFDESNLYRNKVKNLNKISKKANKSRSKINVKRSASSNTLHDLATKPIIPKGVTIPVLNKSVEKKYQKMRSKPDEEEDELF